MSPGPFNRTVTLQRCSLLTTPGSDGTLPLDRATDGTGYLSMTGVTLKAVS